MASKTTTKKTTRKKTTRKKATKKAANATAAEAPVAEAKAEAPASAAKAKKTKKATKKTAKKAVRKTATAKAKTKRATKTAGDKAAKSAPAAKSTPAKADSTEQSDGVRVEEQNGAIVIRFPSASARGEEPAAPAPVESEPAPKEAKAKRPAGKKQSSRRADAPDETTAAAPIAEASADEPEAPRKNRRRRGRRRRGRGGQSGQDESTLAATESTPAADDVDDIDDDDDDDLTRAETELVDDADVRIIDDEDGVDEVIAVLADDDFIDEFEPDDLDEDEEEDEDDDDDAGANGDTTIAAKTEESPSRGRRRRRGRRGRRRDAEEAPETSQSRETEVEDEEDDDEAPARERKDRRQDRGRRRQRRPRRFEDDRAAMREADRGLSIEVEIDEDELEQIEADVEPREREMVINVVPREECRIAILEDSRLEEIYLERASSENYVSNIYKGVVTNVESSIQAAFIDFGMGKNGFLHISDLHPQYFPSGDKRAENVGHKIPRRVRPPIQKCLRRGQEILVQITKEGIGTKGPTLTTYLSIPGRFLVMMPSMRRVGVSRKIEDETARRNLRRKLNQLKLPEDVGFIARTAAEGRTVDELQSDLNYLTRLWRAVQKRIKRDKAPAELYRESDLVIRTIRDVYTSDIKRILIDSDEVAERAREFLSIFSPDGAKTIESYDDPEPIFHQYGIEAELERLHSRHVPLKSGGSLVIDQTEALVAIDVNSGKFRKEDDAETTAFKINCEAADEIPRQLRLRDLGGVVICDFIDMIQQRHRRSIEKRLVLNLKQHKERAQVLRMSAFGLVEMTRQRQRASLTRSVYQDCSHCRGSGLVKTAESVALDCMRLLQLAATKDNIRTIEVTVSSEVANLLLNRKRIQIADLEREHNRNVTIQPDANVGLDQVRLQSYDARGRLVPHS